jgi:hypothetical protein
VHGHSVSDRKDENSGIASATNHTQALKSRTSNQVIRRTTNTTAYYLGITYTTGTTKEPKPHPFPFGKGPQALTPAQTSAPCTAIT